LVCRDNVCRPTRSSLIEVCSMIHVCSLMRISQQMLLAVNVSCLLCVVGSPGHSAVKSHVDCTYVIVSNASNTHTRQCFERYRYKSSSSLAPQCYKRTLASSRRFSTSFFLQGEGVSVTPKSQPGGLCLRVYTLRRQGRPAIPPGTG
jgi:hypothetical protein